MSGTISQVPRRRGRILPSTKHTAIPGPVPRAQQHSEVDKYPRRLPAKVLTNTAENSSGGWVRILPSNPNNLQCCVGGYELLL
ncbi:hypothetical protein BDZ89DRAFT_1081049 [Hymenopellis radicata]|nr:hypothetical protein BDZ89DRAFT_1081049 [Hymenopellis radicata]